MNCKITPSQSRHLAEKTVDRLVLESMERHQIVQDAMWLMAIRRQLGFGKKRLTAVYKAFYETRAENKQFYCTEPDDEYSGVLGVAAVTDLNNIGIDINELYKTYGEPIIKAELHNK